MISPLFLVLAVLSASGRCDPVQGFESPFHSDVKTIPNRLDDLDKQRVCLTDTVTNLSGTLHELSEKEKPTPKDHVCPDGFHQHGDSCYWFSTFSETFMSARTICDHMGSHLAIITSEAEDNFINEWALQRGKAVYYWLGGSDLGLEGHWKWEGGRPMVYTNWYPGGPENYGGQQACLVIDKRTHYQWNDASCNSKANIICEA